MDVLRGIADVILVLAAVFSLVAFAFLAYAGLIIIRLVKEVKGEVGVLTGQAKDSMRETQATGHYVAESIVKPASTAIGYVTGVRATIKALTEDVMKRSRS